MRMLALQDVPNSCSQIVKGQEFIEPNPEQATYWISTGVAEPIGAKRRLVPDWGGSTVCIMASGPSMTQEQADYVRGRCKTIVINTTFRLAPWADMLYACDYRWWNCSEKGKTYYEEAREIFGGELWTQDAQAKVLDGMHHVNSSRLPGLGKTEGTIHQGANSGYQAINIAYQAGAARIVLLGYDMKEADKKSHWHGDHPNPINAKNPYKLWLENFNQLAADLKAEGVQVVNCTPGTALKAFPKMDLAAAL